MKRIKPYVPPATLQAIYKALTLTLLWLLFNPVQLEWLLEPVMMLEFHHFGCNLPSTWKRWYRFTNSH
jgi:hypothetical protein